MHQSDSQRKDDAQPVPKSTLIISLAALAVPVGAAIWLPDWTANGAGMLIWLTALIPAFLLAYYRGLTGVAIALAGGMAVITATQVGIVAFAVADPNWTALAAVVTVYLGVSIGIGVLAEVLRRDRGAAEAMALVDRLTGLPNRRYADIVLEQTFAAAARGADLSIVLFDLDRFKDVNGGHGRVAGDAVLQAFAKILKANTRRENLSARFGGEEFIAILLGTDSDLAVVFAQRVLDQTRGLRFAWGTQTVSAGVVSYEEGMGSYELLVSAADHALYQAKESGRDMVCVAPRHAARSPEATPVAAPAVPASARAARAAATAATAATAGTAGTAGTARARTAKPLSTATPPAETRPFVYVIDDDAAIRSVLKRVLISRGYRTWDTGIPADAVRRFAESSAAERPRLILADVIMPGMTGTRMIEQITALDPGVKVIYMSGYVHSEISYTGTPGAEVSFLEKPISADRLMTAVERILHNGAEAQPA